MPLPRWSRAPWVPLVGVALLASALFMALSSEFLRTFNVYTILSAAALMAVVGFAQVTVLSVGEFSLAVAGIGGLTGVIVGNLLVKQGFPLVPAIVIGLAFGAACGFANGLLVVRSGVDGFIITLATGGAFSGLTLAITKSQPYNDLPKLMNSIGTGRIGFIPYILAATLLVAVALAALYRWRATGRTMLAVGGNAEAAQLSGLSPARAKIWAHTLSGLLSGVAGAMAMAMAHEADPNAGVDWLIQSFTVAIIGGTALAGGAVSIGGVLVAALILAIINNGLVLVNVNPFWMTFVEGVLVFAAVVLGRATNWQLLRGAIGRAGAWRRPQSAS
ncbi:MAG: ribose transport system permease protein [Solirubrobacteraceae bacterium]|jgi:ribose transport system permease protein|nr:ribose transport system permease protein [Solirubrobacteraceae bacterium]